MSRGTWTATAGKIAIGAAGALVGRAVVQSQRIRLATMSGTTIAAPSAAGWVTDFLNAAYFRRAPAERHIDDLRLAFGVLTTRWHRLGRRLHAGDVAAFHRAFGVARLTDEPDSPRGTLTNRELRIGSAELLGHWFPDAWDDQARRGWGIAFPTATERDAYQAEVRLERAQLGGITPPTADPADQTWHTYPPVWLGGPAAMTQALDALGQPETWPDYGSELGRFTPVRRGGLDGQTFEIEVVGEPVGPIPLLLRAYVTATIVLHAGSELDAACAELNRTFARYTPADPVPVPEGAQPQVLVELTTHSGHFLGRARNRILMYTDDEGAWIRAAGTWDPLDWPLDRLYTRMGRHSQHAFWGMGEPDESMLHQVAAAAGEPA